MTTRSKPSVSVGGLRRRLQVCLGGSVRWLLRPWAGAALLTAAATLPLTAQGNCNVNNQSTCQVGGTTAYGMRLTISTVVRLSLPSATIALGTATPADFTAGFGTPLLVPLSIRANTGWTVSISATSTLWSATPAAARQNKPAADLQWGTATTGPFTDLSGSPVAIRAGTATAAATIPLYVRSRYAWTLDKPGSYSLPLQLTITAP